MIEKILSFLNNICNGKFSIVKKRDFSYQSDKKFFAVDEFIILYDPAIEPKKIYHIKIFIENLLNEYKRLQTQKRKFTILQKELDIILQANQIFLEKRGDLSGLFRFLKRYGARYALIENGHLIIDEGIDTFTIETTIKKLKKRASIHLPVANEELFAIKVGFYILILIQEHIDPFTKRILQTRLMWLNAMFEAKALSEIDKLTGLFTRTRFLQDLPVLNEPLIFVNIKNFRTINELYTSTIGDRVLQDIAHRLQKTTNKSYRIYGDRFVLVAQEINPALKRLQKLLSKPFYIYNDKIKESITLRIETQLLIFQKPTQEILEKAITSFKKSQEPIIYYEEDIAPLLQEEIEHYKILLEAMEQDRIVPFLQRVIRGIDGETAYFEALMRIAKDEKILPPRLFLDVAKERGIYHKLNLLMIEKCFRIAEKKKIPISINVDIFDILQAEFLPTIKKLFEKSRVDPSQIQFELLEDEDFYAYIEEVKHFVDTIRQLGAKVALDDFGKGFSNFSILKELSIDNIKIDMSLAKDIDKSSSYEILRSIVDLANALDIHTTLEGIGERSIYEKATKLNITNLQGFFIHKPQHCHLIE